MMDRWCEYISGKPLLAAGISLFALADAANCIRLGHADWFIPAIAAFAAACMVPRK